MSSRYSFESFLARYFRSRLRRPTSTSSPRRAIKSLWFAFRWSVNSLIRAVNAVICALGEPVSTVVFFFVSVMLEIDYIKFLDHIQELFYINTPLEGTYSANSASFTCSTVVSFETAIASLTS